MDLAKVPCTVESHKMRCQRINLQYLQDCFVNFSGKRNLSSFEETGQAADRYDEGQHMPILANHT